MRTLLVLLLALAAPSAQAHKPSDSYLAIRVQGTGVSGQWDIALRDLDFAIGLDDSGDGDITWGEVKAHHADIGAYALARLKLRSGGADCAARSGEFLVDDHSDGAYSVVRFTANCPGEITTLEIGYSLQEGWCKVDAWCFDPRTDEYVCGWRDSWGRAYIGFFDDVYPEVALGSMVQARFQ